MFTNIADIHNLAKVWVVYTEYTILDIHITTGQYFPKGHAKAFSKPESNAKRQGVPVLSTFESIRLRSISLLML